MEKKTIKLERGTIYQKVAGGNFYFRYQVNRQRKSVSLHTTDESEAREKALEMLPVLHAPSLEVVAAHVSHANFGVERKNLSLKDAWKVYDCHPDKATPSTVSEQQAYEITWRDFLKHLKNPGMLLDDVTPALAVKYANYMRTLEIAVDTHNRKIRRLKKIFQTLSDYYQGDNPFTGRSLMRKSREEQNGVRRLSFTRKQEQELLKALEDPTRKVMNKREIRVLYHLGLFTGQRMKDCALLQWNRVNFDRKRIWVKQFKTGKEVTIPIADKLMEVLQEAKSWECNEYVLPALAERYQTRDKNGKCIGANLLNIDVMRVIRWIGLEPSVKVPGRKKKVTVYGFHSLRHSFASHCAEAGVPKAVAQSILGADSDIIDKYYVHIGEEAQEKAIQLISGDGSTLAQRHQKALDFINGLKKKSANLKKIESILRG